MRLFETDIAPYGEVLLYSSDCDTGNRIDTIPECQTLTDMESNHFTLHFCVPTFMLETLTLPSEKRYAVTYVSRVFNVKAG
ncbi:hypothetical protein NLX67_19475 [Domibacillus sp. A3M-37]|uniref:hypothetical protein n=1 Tax=Domibacillus sp. A3M-37 TaxID=2962037 RepID=UPI0020B758F9|nr:hypothetical protein [Domibacillus sp. A3M-37]MCP3764527.1 hypothetical protein [Domibacillus sp. A3M-37]